MHYFVGIWCVCFSVIFHLNYHIFSPSSSKDNNYLCYLFLSLFLLGNFYRFSSLFLSLQSFLRSNLFRNTTYPARNKSNKKKSSQNRFNYFDLFIHFPNNRFLSNNSIHKIWSQRDSWVRLLSPYLLNHTAHLHLLRGKASLPGNNFRVLDYFEKNNQNLMKMKTIRKHMEKIQHKLRGEERLLQRKHFEKRKKRSSLRNMRVTRSSAMRQSTMYRLIS